MQKYHKIVSIFLSIAFLIVLQEFSVPRPIFRFLVPAILLFLGVLTLYNRWYLKTIGSYNPWVLLRPVLFYSSAFSLFLIVVNDFLRGVFLLSIVLLGSLFENFVGNFAENIMLNETLIIAFGVFMSVSAYAQVYAPAFQTLYLVFIFIATFLATRALYEFIPEPNSSKVVAAVVIAFFMTEVFWAMTFLPFHYSASALMLFNVYYFCLILNYYYSFNTLNIRKFQFHLVLMSVCSGFIFLLTPWKILG